MRHSGPAKVLSVAVTNDPQMKLINYPVMESLIEPTDYIIQSVVGMKLSKTGVQLKLKSSAPYANERKYCLV